MHFKMSYAICFNLDQSKTLDQSKILSSGNGLRQMITNKNKTFDIASHHLPKILTKLENDNSRQ